MVVGRLVVARAGARGAGRAAVARRPGVVAPAVARRVRGLGLALDLRAVVHDADQLAALSERDGEHPFSKDLTMPACSLPSLMPSSSVSASRGFVFARNSPRLFKPSRSWSRLSCLTLRER